MLTRKRKTDLEKQNTQKNTTAEEIMSNSSSLESSRDSEKSSFSLTNIPFGAESWQDVKKKLKSLAWIQCDNPDCRKWRKIPGELLKNIEEWDKWFCHQNSDPNFSSCSVPEEDVQLYDQLADRSGLKYLKSQLSPGDLVWAKMDGYCSWPSVVTPEPGTDEGHLCRYEDEEIAFYHVEFLGQPHSHGWVKAKSVTAFTPSSVSQQRASSVGHRKRGSGRKRKGGGRKQKPLCAAHTPALKTVYRTGVSVEHGVSEAMTLLPLSPAQRLASCIYLHTPQLPAENSGVMEDSGCKLTGERLWETGDLKQKHTGQMKSKSSPCDQPDASVSQFTFFDSCLQNKTKEERLMLDVEMYKQNERAFVHDVTRFSLRNGLKPSKGPFWQNQNISLFQLFLAVHERGGYEQVTRKKKWAAVYREVTETPCQKDVSNSCGARLFYYRHLYPYELYIHGKDFTKEVSELRNDTTCQSTQKKTRNKTHIKQRAKKTVPLQKQTLCNIDDRLMEGEEDIASDSLREMLQTLEENSLLAFGDGPMGTGIDITFYDDSTPSKGRLQPLAHFEPQDAPRPLMAASPDDSVTEGASSDSQQILHPLKNVSHAPSEQNKLGHQNSHQVVPSAVDNSPAEEKEEDPSSASAAFSQQELLEELSVLQDAISFIDHHVH